MSGEGPGPAPVTRPRWRRWHTTDLNRCSDGWHGQLDVGRVQVGYRVWRHRSTLAPTRWVLQPWMTLDWG
jgi:hypothetical protein